jgi:catechol 2,3-dioxygenase-like lactoylglutathione lyase family enzyme
MGAASCRGPTSSLYIRSTTSLVHRLYKTRGGSLDHGAPEWHHALVTDDTPRLVTVVFTVSDLDRAVKLYRDGFGLDLHLSDHQGDDAWTSGRHAAISWSDGAFMHFALYESRDGTSTSGAQIAFRVGDVDAAHERAVEAGAEVIHRPRRQPWGTSARYRDADGNVIELTQRP